MPIWSQDEDYTTARFAKEELAGNVVHFASEPNPQLKEKYRSEGKPVQHDRAFVAEMPGVAASSFKRIIADSMQKAYESAVQLRGILPKGDTSGTTATLALYDPTTFTLEIGNRADSPVFLILEEGRKTKAVLISSDADVNPKTGAITSWVENPFSRSPVRESSYDLEKLIAEHKEKDGFSDACKAHLLVCSDGMHKLPYDQMPTIRDHEHTIASHFGFARRKNVDNLAQQMSSYCYHNTDNITGILIEDIQKCKGSAPIAAGVCDGFGTNGAMAAEYAIRAMQNVVKQEIEAAKPKEIRGDKTAAELERRTPRGPSQERQ